MAEKEYIDRETMLARVDEEFLKTDPSGEEQLGFLKCRRIIRELPAADVVEVVHARWITEENTEGYRGDPHCTACKGILDDEAVYGHTPGVDSFFYCPLCGAKMDGGKDD